MYWVKRLSDDKPGYVIIMFDSMPNTTTNTNIEHQNRTNSLKGYEK